MSTGGGVAATPVASAPPPVPRAAPGRPRGPRRSPRRSSRATAGWRRPGARRPRARRCRGGRCRGRPGRRREMGGRAPPRRDRGVSPACGWQAPARSAGGTRAGPHQRQPRDHAMPEGPLRVTLQARQRGGGAVPHPARDRQAQPGRPAVRRHPPRRHLTCPQASCDSQCKPVPDSRQGAARAHDARARQPVPVAAATVSGRRPRQRWGRCP